MSGYTLFLEEAITNHILGHATYTPPADVYLALYTTATDETGAGTEVTGGTYARQLVTFGVWATGGALNDASVTFTGLPAATITHAALLDASVAGNMLMEGYLTSQQTVLAGDSINFAIGSINSILD